VKKVLVGMAVFPVWAEIDLSAISHNVREIRRVTTPAARVMAVVKADGYGHGAVEVSRTALDAGAEWLGVARTGEGAALRDVGIEAPVLVLGYTPPEQFREVLEKRLAQAVYNRKMALDLAAEAGKAGEKARVHLKVDTGMGRLGWLAGAGACGEILDLARNPHLELEGIFTHFAAADALDQSYTLEQFHKFIELTEQLRRSGLEFPLRHAANSAALLGMPETHLDMVRAGIAIYGLKPSDEVNYSNVRLRPALELKARIAHVKEVPAGFAISYGCTYRTVGTTCVATLPLGYADGYPRLLSSRGEALIHGCRAPVVGRVCMDQIMVDVGHIQDVKTGDEAVLIGHQDDEEITAEEVASEVGTIHYEIVSQINARVPRVYR
jgi:alanine racemase